MNKKILNILFICVIVLFFISSVNAMDDDNVTVSSENTVHQITSDLSNNDIQNMFDSANEGDTFDFTSKEYNDISLVVDKKLNIVSNVKSVVYTSNKVSDKAKSLGISDTFGFYFTSNGCGSVLSGSIIKATNSDYGIVVSSDNVTVKNNVVIGGTNGLLVKNSNYVSVISNDISNAKQNGLQIQDTKNSIFSKNTIHNNVRSGIETSNIYHCDITNNTIYKNQFNGISMYNKSDGNIIKQNQAYENPNGIFIDSQSTNDAINANSFTSNRRDTNYELGAFESGNGILFGIDFTTAKEGNPSRLEVKYNVLAHNEGYQAKNNPDLPVFKLGDNWFDSTDDENTFVCPMLLAGIMKMGTISVKNGIGLQMYDTKGNAVKEFGTFDTTVNIDGNKYTAKFINGKATIEANIDPDKEYDIEVMIGGQPVKYKYKAASGDENDDEDSKTSQNTEGERGSSGDSSKVSSDSNKGISKGNQNPSVETSQSAHFSLNDNHGVYGTNASGTFQDSSDNGQDVQTKGDVNAGDSSNGEVSKEGKAYEVVPESKISKEITDTSGVVVLAIVSLLGCLVYGYWRKEEFDN